MGSFRQTFILHTFLVRARGRLTVCTSFFSSLAASRGCEIYSVYIYTYILGREYGRIYTLLSAATPRTPSRSRHLRLATPERRRLSAPIALPQNSRQDTPFLCGDSDPSVILSDTSYERLTGRLDCHRRFELLRRCDVCALVLGGNQLKLPASSVGRNPAITLHCLSRQSTSHSYLTHNAAHQWTKDGLVRFIPLNGFRILSL